MRNPPEDEYDQKELKELNALPWQFALLGYNPDYTCWGPHEDYMINNSQWASPIFYNNWLTHEMVLDELNEVFNFYFEIDRKQKNCTVCDVLSRAHCSNCNGKGHVYTADEARVSLVYWLVHPRKGCTRGVEVKNIQETDLPEVFAFLHEAKDRVANLFSKLPPLEKQLG